MKNNHLSQNSVQEFVEMQDHQYFPGYFTGGKVHPFFSSHSKLVKYSLFTVGSMLLIVSVFSLLTGVSHHDEAIGFIPLTLVALTVGCLCFLASNKK